MVDIMKDVIQRGTAAGSVGSVFRVPAGGKTGTTNDGADVWFIGYTADLVAGVWMGMDRPAKIKSNAQGGVLAAPAWTAFMTEVYRRKPSPPDWPKPEIILAREIDRTNGLLKNPFCPPDVVYTEYYIPGTEPVRECDLHTPFDISPDSASGVFGAPGTTGGGTTTTGPGTMRVTPGGAPVPQASGRPGKPKDTTNIFKLPP
jgi:penicillin-binding protein 1A